MATVVKLGVIPEDREFQVLKELDQKIACFRRTAPESVHPLRFCDRLNILL